MADSSWSSSWPARRSSARGTMSQQPRDRQPAALQEPQRGHLALLLGRTVAQIGLEDRLLAHGEDLVAVPLLEQPGTDHAAKHLTGDGLHVAGREPLVAAHHRSERSTSCGHVRRVQADSWCGTPFPAALGWRPQPQQIDHASLRQPPGGGRYRLPATGPSGTPATAGSPMRRRRVTSVPGRALARRSSSTSWPISHSPRPRRLATGAVRKASGRPRSRMVTWIQPPPTLTVTVTGCASSDPYRMALVAASLTARTRSSTTSSGMAAGTSAKLCRMARRSSARQLGEPANEVSMSCPLPALRLLPWADAMVWPRLTRPRAPRLRAAGAGRAGSGSAWQAEAMTAGASSTTVRCPEAWGGATPRPYACASTGGWLARSRACCAWLDASRSSASRPRRSRSWRRVALSRSSSATLLSRSRRAARSWRRLARRAPEERQASPSSSAPSRPSPAATSSSWPWVKPVIDWSKTETELALVLARTASPSTTASTTASTRNNAAMLPPVALEWLGSGAARVPTPVGLRKRLAFPHRLRRPTGVGTRAAP